MNSGVWRQYSKRAEDSEALDLLRPWGEPIIGDRIRMSTTIIGQLATGGSSRCGEKARERAWMRGSVGHVTPR